MKSSPVNSAESVAAAEIGGLTRETAYGWVAIAATRQGVLLVTLPTVSEREAIARAGEALGRPFAELLGAPQESQAAALLAQLCRDMADYFAGKPVDFSSYPLDLSGSPFVEAVRAAVRAIPYGQTRSYGEVAAAVGRPGAARAVGQVMAKNPVPVLIPCHRVVGATNHLHGFGGGLPLKERMLRMEGVAFTGPGRVAREKP